MIQISKFKIYAPPEFNPLTRKSELIWATERKRDSLQGIWMAQMIRLLITQIYPKAKFSIFLFIIITWRNIIFTSYDIIHA